MTDPKSWGRAFEWLPFLRFPPEWQVQLIPPTNGAAVRFRVRLYESARPISVYLDLDENLGSFGGPYWEIYPNSEGDAERFAASEVDELIAAINVALAVAR